MAGNDDEDGEDAEIYTIDLGGNDRIPNTASLKFVITSESEGIVRA